MAPEPSQEPQSRLHAELKAYATARRQAAGEFRLPPATRLALRREVDRQFGGPRPGRLLFSAWLRRLPAWGWLATTALVLSAGGLVWSRMGQVPHSSEVAGVGTPAPSQALATAPLQVAAPVESPALVMAPPSPMPEGVPAPAAAPLRLATRSAAPQASPTLTAAAPSAKARTTAKAAGPAPLSQTFVRTAAAGRSVDAFQTGATPVLSRFRFDLSGQQVRVVDADGSVYDGRVVARPVDGVTALAASDRATPTTAAPITAARSDPKGAAARGVVAERAASTTLAVPAAVPGELHFEVRGTNVTVGRPVQLEGMVTPVGATAPAAAPATGVAGGVWLQNAAIQGQLRVGGEQPTFLQAQPAVAPAPRR